MAITRTQIAKQLLAQGGRTGFQGGGRDMGGVAGASRGPAGGASAGGDYGGNRNPSQDYGGGSGDSRDQRRETQYITPTNVTKKEFDDRLDRARNFRDLQKVQQAFTNKTLFDRIPSSAKILSGIFRGNVDFRKEFAKNNPDLLDYINSLTEEEQSSNKLMTALNEIGYGNFLASEKGAPGLMMAGNVGGLEKFVKEDGTFGYRNVGGGEDSNILLPQMIAQAPSIMEQEPEEEEGLRLAFRAEGGPIGGGIMNLESARQELFLGGVADAIGKSLKKVTRGIKKIGKSPIGKAALLYAGIGGLGNLAGGSGLGGMFKGFTSPSSFLGGASKIFSKEGLRNIAFGAKGVPQLGIKGTSGLFGTGGEFSPFKAIAGVSTLSGFLTPEQEEEAQQLADDTGFSIEEARNSILARARDDYKMDFRARGFRAEGGPAEGKEPVAKKTMPLLDMGGQEMDLRAEGGFVPIGRMEKADDVPARLSKNEFVFTADAVRNAGDGDVDKGAEVMYNMMKNLESGGDVSEESQGLEGAREMFKTSQRLEEVL